MRGRGLVGRFEVSEEGQFTLELRLNFGGILRVLMVYYMFNGSELGDWY